MTDKRCDKHPTEKLQFLFSDWERECDLCRGKGKEAPQTIDGIEVTTTRGYIWLNRGTATVLGNFLDKRIVHGKYTFTSLGLVMMFRSNVDMVFQSTDPLDSDCVQWSVVT